MKRFIFVFIAVILIASAMSGCDIFDSDSSGGGNQNAQKCTQCGGSGKTVCTWCNGNGHMQVSDFQYACNGCAGSGKANCLGCNGTGYKRSSSGANTGDVYIPSYDFGGGWQSTCYTCNGAGKVTCSSCHGTGSLGNTQYAPDFGFGGGSYQTGQTCYACSGSGLVMCTSCMGDGYN